MLGAEVRQTRAVTAQSREAEFGGWLNVPLGPSGEIASSGLVTQTFALSTTGLTAACIGDGGVFGAVDPVAPAVLVNGIELGPDLRLQRKVLLHHRFSSPFGAGWGIGEVSRLFASGDVAFLVRGDGREEEFSPRARLTPMADSLGARTTLLSGLAFPSEPLHGLAIANVRGVRHFVLATSTTLRDIAASGATRAIASRSAPGGANVYSQAAVAAQGDVVFYTAGGADATPVLYKANLSAATPALEALSATTGDTRLFPRAPLSGVTFEGPRGLAVGLDGTLYLADARRHSVYAIRPQAGGAIGAASVVEPVLGNGLIDIASPGCRSPMPVRKRPEPASASRSRRCSRAIRPTTRPARSFIAAVTPTRAACATRCA